jgi:hypothetical protein
MDLTQRRQDAKELPVKQGEAFRDRLSDADDPLLTLWLLLSAALCDSMPRLDTP